MRGVPRVPWEAEGIFDGISEYKLDRKGKIYEHKLTNVQMRDPPLARSPLSIGLNLIPVPRLQGAPQVLFRPLRPKPDAPEGLTPSHDVSCLVNVCLHLQNMLRSKLHHALCKGCNQRSRHALFSRSQYIV